MLFVIRSLGKDEYGKKSFDKILKEIERKVCWTSGQVADHACLKKGKNRGVHMDGFVVSVVERSQKKIGFSKLLVFWLVFLKGLL